MSVENNLVLVAKHQSRYEVEKLMRLVPTGQVMGLVDEKATDLAEAIKLIFDCLENGGFNQALQAQVTETLASLERFSNSLCAFRIAETCSSPVGLEATAISLKTGLELLKPPREMEEPEPQMSEVGEKQ